MLNKFWVTVVLFCALLACNCKKENGSCNTTADCQAIGEYLVIPSITESDGPNLFFDSTYAPTLISITEVSPGVIEFKDTSTLHQQFNASYNSASSTSNYPVFTSSSSLPLGSNQISILGSDTIDVSVQSHISAGGQEYTDWHGVRVH
jgi:hypothetical protein